jgi:HAD superfamily hydrolase (TIGR01509 family)
MLRRRPEVLLFDLGGVLVENVMFDELPSLLPERLENEELRRRWLLSPAVQAFERGGITADDFAAAFAAEWRLEVSAAQFLENFASWPRGPYPGALELLDHLRADYRLALLTNCNSVHWDRVGVFRSRVHASFSSHILGVVKPDPAIFREVVGALNVEPGAVSFFDDSLANVEAARAVGMDAHLTRGLREVELAIQALIA